MNHDNIRKRCLNFELSPTESNNFYFPAGSLSSYQESFDFNEEDQEYSLEKENNNEECPAFLNPLDVIPYEQQSFSLCDSNHRIDDLVSEFTVGYLKFSDSKEMDEEKYRELMGEYKSLQEKFEKFKQNEIRVQDSGNCTDLTTEDIVRIQKELEKKSEENIVLKSELNTSHKGNLELQKSLKVAKNEISLYKEKVSLLNSDILKLKFQIEEIVDEDGTSKTSRNSGHEANSFEFIRNKLEIIKSKLKKSSNFSDPVKETREPLIKDLNSQIRQKNSMIISLECKLNEALKPHSFKDSDEEVHTERPRSTTSFENDPYTERITYRDVLRDLKEITTRASKALKNSCISKRVANYSASNLKDRKMAPTERSYYAAANERIDELNKIKRPHLRKG